MAVLPNGHYYGSDVVWYTVRGLMREMQTSETQVSQMPVGPAEGPSFLYLTLQLYFWLMHILCSSINYGFLYAWLKGLEEGQQPPREEDIHQNATLFGRGWGQGIPGKGQPHPVLTNKKGV